jgi:uncharacterized membrane protein
MVQKVVDFLNVFQGTRKTLVMLFLIALSIVFRIKGYIDGNNLVDLLKATALGFFASNSFEHYTSIIKSKIDAKTGKTEEIEEIEVEPESK